jgi:hypothetical protein
MQQRQKHADMIVPYQKTNDKKKALKMKKKRESSSKVEPIILGPALTDDGSTDFTDDVE